MASRIWAFQSSSDETNQYRGETSSTSGTAHSNNLIDLLLALFILRETAPV